MSKSIYPFNLVDDTNKEIKQYGKELQIVQHEKEPDLYCIDILDIGKDGETVKINTFADYLYEYELQEKIEFAFEHVALVAELNAGLPNYITFRKVSGWTHDLPALIHSLTEFPLFFADVNGTIENVDSQPGGIDAFQDRTGCFCVRPEDYAPALMQIEAHDNKGVER
jgi:hypothetical protein